MESGGPSWLVTSLPPEHLLPYFLSPSHISYIYHSNLNTAPAGWLAPMHRPAISVLGDSIACRKHPEPHLRKAISIPSVTTLVKDSWNWAGDTIHTYRDGLTRNERRAKAEIEDRKQVLYLRIKNVSTIHRTLVHFLIRPAGRVVRRMGKLRMRTRRVGR